jgi:hypothetical protein
MTPIKQSAIGRKMTVAGISLLLTLSLMITRASADTLEDWRELNYGMFIHFGMATFTGRVNENDQTYGADAAVDGYGFTRWATADGTKSAWLEVDLGKQATVGRVVVEQALPELNRVRKFAIEYKKGDTWKPCYQGEDPGPRLDVGFDAVSAQHFRLNIIESTGGPTISEFQLYQPAKSK